MADEIGAETPITQQVSSLEGVSRKDRSIISNLKKEVSFEDPAYDKKMQTIDVLSDMMIDPSSVEDMSVPERVRERISKQVIYAMVDGLYKAGLSSADPKFSRNMYDIADYFQRRSQNANGDSEVRQIWNDVKSNLAVIKQLKRAGFRVYLPDYSQDFEDEFTRKDEIYNWTMANAVSGGNTSFIAEHGGRVYLVDCRGEERQSEEKALGAIRRKIETLPGRIFYRTVGSARINETKELPSSLEEFIFLTYDKNYPEMIASREIVVPTSSNYLTPLEPSNRSDRGKEELARFAILRSSTDK